MNPIVKTGKAYILVVLVLMILTPPFLIADGMMFTYETGETSTDITDQTIVAENSQRVLLVHNTDNNTQKTVIEVRSGEAAGDFIWIIPIVNEEDLTAAEFIAGVSEEPDCDTLFNGLAEAAGPEITVVRHEITESYRGSNYYSPFACTVYMGEDGGEYSEVDAEAEESALPDWAELTTDSFDIDMIKGENGEEIISWLETEGLTEIAEELTDIARHYSLYTNIGYLILRSVDPAAESINTGISFSTKNTAPFFPLEISQPGFQEEMVLEIYTAEETEIRWKPNGSCEDYLWDINLENYSSELLTREVWEDRDPTVAAGDFYWVNYNYTNDSDEELIEAALQVIEENNYYGYNYGYYDDSYPDAASWFQTFAGTLDSAGIATIPGLADHTSASSLEVTAFRKTAGEAEELIDLTFNTDEEEDFRGGMRIHIAVRSGSLAMGEMPIDYGLLLPLLFPAWMAVGRFRKKQKNR